MQFMAEKNIENKYRKLTDIEHVLNRSSVYIGSTKKGRKFISIN